MRFHVRVCDKDNRWFSSRSSCYSTVTTRVTWLYDGNYRKKFLKQVCLCKPSPLLTTLQFHCSAAAAHVTDGMMYEGQFYLEVENGSRCACVHERLPKQGYYTLTLLIITIMVTATQQQVEQDKQPRSSLLARLNYSD